MKGATIQARNILLSVVLVWMCMCVHAGRYVCMQAREREVDSTFYCHILSNSYVRSFILVFALFAIVCSLSVDRFA